MGTKKILIVDDEPQMVDMIKMRLQGSGYNVITAQDGQEGLDKVRQELPDLVILDVMMPKMDGYKVCGLLKSDGRYKQIPIIMFTARAQEADRQLSEDVGANAYINKPLNPAEMIEKVTKLLGDH